MICQNSVMIKLSGSALETSSGLIDVNYLEQFGRFVAALSPSCQIAVTVGGGSLARRYISAAKQLGLPNSRASVLGGDVGLLNCRLVIASLVNAGASVSLSPIESWDLAQKDLRSGNVPVLYGRWPALTSDSVAAYFADYASMSLVVKLSTIDAIYNKDPNVYTDAKLIRFLSHDQLEEMSISRDRRTSGSHFVVDLLAAKRLKNSRLPLLFLHKDSLQFAMNLIKNQLDWRNLSEGTLVGQWHHEHDGCGPTKN